MRCVWVAPGCGLCRQRRQPAGVGGTVETRVDPACMSHICHMPPAALLSWTSSPFLCQLISRAAYSSSSGVPARLQAENTSRHLQCCFMAVLRISSSPPRTNSSEERLTPGSLERPHACRLKTRRRRPRGRSAGRLGQTWRSCPPAMAITDLGRGDGCKTFWGRFMPGQPLPKAWRPAAAQGLAASRLPKVGRALRCRMCNATVEQKCIEPHSY